MKLTKVQQAVFEAIKARGYIHNISWEYSGTTVVPGYPHRVTDATLRALRRAGLIVGKAVPAGGAYPDGHINESRVSSYIQVPKETA